MVYVHSLGNVLFTLVKLRRVPAPLNSLDQLKWVLDWLIVHGTFRFIVVDIHGFGCDVFLHLFLYLVDFYLLLFNLMHNLLIFALEHKYHLLVFILFLFELRLNCFDFLFELQCLILYFSQKFILFEYGIFCLFEEWLILLFLEIHCI